MPAEAENELLSLLTLRFTNQLGPRRIEKLRRHFGSAAKVLAADAFALREVEGLDSRSLASIGSPEASAKAAAELVKVKASGVNLLGRGLAGYPEALESLQDPPPILWVKGELPELETVPQSIGIVGTRAASPHALSLTRSISSELARAGVIIVSGLARGVDTAAHSAAVEAEGISIGVLGSAVDVIYPSENFQLASKLVLVSEYPLGTSPSQHHFPVRNRIIAALSAGSLVVEGELKSGSMITATHALECGRCVFAVPGRAGDPRASGPHRLLREGAVLTENATDIFNELGWKSVAAPNLDLPADQLRALKALSTPSTLEDLMHKTSLDLASLNTALVMLQLAGLVDELGGRWSRR